MKKEIHPTYYPEARVICSCGNTWTTGSTAPEIRTDVCSQCHPFYTGEQRIVDTAGQVDRFMKRLSQYSAHREDAAMRQQVTQKKAEQRFLKQQLMALDLSDSVFQTLHDNNVITVGDLVRKVEKDRDSLKSLSGFNEETIKDVEAKLKAAREAYFAKA